MLTTLISHLEQINQSPCRCNETNTVAYNFDLLPLDRLSLTLLSHSDAITVMQVIRQVRLFYFFFDCFLMNFILIIDFSNCFKFIFMIFK